MFYYRRYRGGYLRIERSWVLSGQKRESLQSNERKQDLIEVLRLGGILGILAVSMLITHTLLGLPSVLAIMVSCVLAYVVSVAFLRRFLPRRPPATDGYRAQHTPRVRVWLLADAICVVLVHFVGGVVWLLSVGAIVMLSLCFVAIEAWLRRRAIRRIA